MSLKLTPMYSADDMPVKFSLLLDEFGLKFFTSTRLENLQKDDCKRKYGKDFAHEEWK
jgi:hypothetical protein